MTWEDFVKIRDRLVENDDSDEAIKSMVSRSFLIDLLDIAFTKYVENTIEIQTLHSRIDNLECELEGYKMVVKHSNDINGMSIEMCRDLIEKELGLKSLFFDDLIYVIVMMHKRDKNSLAEVRNSALKIQESIDSFLRKKVIGNDPLDQNLLEDLKILHETLTKVSLPERKPDVE